MLLALFGVSQRQMPDTRGLIDLPMAGITHAQQNRVVAHLVEVD